MVSKPFFMQTSYLTCNSAEKCAKEQLSGKMKITVESAKFD